MTAFPKYTMVKVTVLSLLLFNSIGCKEKVYKEVPAELSIVSDGLDSNRAWPKPDRFVEGIPVYETFKSLEPLFRYDNDTTFVINFWATWCKPCIEELSYFEELNAQHKSEKVKVILVSLDFPKQIASNLVPFVQKKQLQSQVIVLLDGKYNDWIDKVSSDWSGAIPATYIYKKGQHRLVGEPFKNYEQLNEVIQAFL